MVSESRVTVATGRLDTLTRIPSHGRNINGSEPRVTEEKTNATSGISEPNARRRSKQVLKLRSNGVENHSSASLALKTQEGKKSVLLLISVRPLSCPLSALLPVSQRARPRLFPAMLRHVDGCVFLQNEAPSHCGNQGGVYPDAALQMQHRLSSLRVNIPALRSLPSTFPSFVPFLIR